MSLMKQVNANLYNHVLSDVIAFQSAWRKCDKTIHNSQFRFERWISLLHFNFSYGKISYKLAMEYVSNFCANLWQKLAYILADFGNKFIRNIYHIISTDIYDKQYFVLFLHLRERE